MSNPFNENILSKENSMYVDNERKPTDIKLSSDYWQARL